MSVRATAPVETCDLPAYCKGMLLVRFRRRGLDLSSGVISVMVSESTGSSGVMLLQKLRERGQLRRDVEMPERQPRDRATVEVMGGPVPPPNRHSIHILRLADDTNLEDIERQFKGASDVVSVSRVPARYIIQPITTLATTARESAPITADQNPNWNLAKIQWAKASASWDLESCRKVHVAVLDTGLDSDHPHLQDCVREYVHDYGSDSEQLDGQDRLGHGTHVAGIICAKTDFGEQVSGVSSAGIHAFKVFGDDHSELIEREKLYAYPLDPAFYLQALARCYDDNLIRIVNLSLGGPAEPDDYEAGIFQDLFDRGISVVAAAGNSGREDAMYPAALPTVIAVGATDKNDQLAHFSTTGDQIWLCAPGVSIKSTLPRYEGCVGCEARPVEDGFERGAPLPRETTFGTFSGTSMAAPHVAGAIACLLGKNSDLSPTDIRTLLRFSAEKICGLGPKEWNESLGWGRLNLAKLLESADSGEGGDADGR